MPVGSQRLRLYTPTGELARELDAWRSIECVLSENQVSPLTIALPPEYPDDIFRRNGRVAYERSPFQYGSFFSPRLVGDTTWILVERERIVDDDGQSTILLHCEHPNRILGSRVVAYNEGTSQADKSDLASEVIYSIVNENFSAATDTARNISSSHFVLDPNPSPGFGATVSKSFSYRTVLTCLQEIAQASAQQDYYMGFEVYTASPPGPFRFRQYGRQRGTNRGFDSGQPFILYSLALQTGGFGASQVSEDWSKAVSFVYAGGAGKQDERVVQTVSDSDLIGDDPFGRYEFFRSVSSDDSTIVQSEGYRTLREMRPRREFEAPFGNQSSFIFDVHYRWGDIIGVQFSAPVIQYGNITSWVEYKFDVRLNPIRIVAQRYFDEEGYIVDETETLDIHLQSLSSVG